MFRKNNKNKRNMIQRGSKEYKRAQEIARNLENDARLDKWNNASRWERKGDALGEFLRSMMDIEAFAAKVAETIYGTLYGSDARLAMMSSKQAWILACAAVENDINY